MAKTIKFNLICDGNPVRTIEDLQNNFSVEDILNYFNNGLLHRWLKVRNYNDELKAVSDINDSDPIQIIQKLIKIFDIDIEENKVEESVYMLKYLNDRKEAFSQYEKNKFKVDKIIDNYHAEYEQLVKRIIDAPDNAAYIKTTIAEIADNYFWIFWHDHRNLFYNFYDNAPLAVFLLLANEKTRYFYLPVSKNYISEMVSKVFQGYHNIMSVMFSIINPDKTKAIMSDDKIKYDIDLPAFEFNDKKSMYNKICDLLNEEKLFEILKGNIKKFSGVTDGYWKDIEPKGSNLMILKMESDDHIRSLGASGEDLSYSDINKKFVILDGIDYKSKDASHKLLYMEV